MTWIAIFNILLKTTQSRGLIAKFASFRDAGFENFMRVVSCLKLIIFQIFGAFLYRHFLNILKNWNR